MAGPTAHPTGVTLASGDPPNSLNAHEGSFDHHLLREAVPRPVLLGGAPALLRLLAQQALEDSASLSE